MKIDFFICKKTSQLSAPIMPHELSSNHYSVIVYILEHISPKLPQANRTYQVPIWYKSKIPLKTSSDTDSAVANYSYSNSKWDSLWINTQILIGLSKMEQYLVDLIVHGISIEECSQSHIVSSASLRMWPSKQENVLIFPGKDWMFGTPSWTHYNQKISRDRLCHQTSFKERWRTPKISGINHILFKFYAISFQQLFFVPWRHHLRNFLSQKISPDMIAESLKGSDRMWIHLISLKVGLPVRMSRRTFALLRGAKKNDSQSTPHSPK